MEYENTREKVSVTSEWPELLGKKELAKRTIDVVNHYLNSKPRNEIPNIEYLVDEVRKINQALEGDIRQCTYIAAVFCDTDYPEIADPYLAYQWDAYGMAQTNQLNWQEFRSMPGGNYEGTVNMFKYKMAQMLVLFGSSEQKKAAVTEMMNYVDRYVGSTWLDIYRLVDTLMGLPVEKVFRNKGYDLSEIADRELAVKYYKCMVDADMNGGYPDSAKAKANEYEPLLGVQYFEERYGRKKKGLFGFLWKR